LLYTEAWTTATINVSTHLVNHEKPLRWRMKSSNPGIQGTYEVSYTLS